MESSSKKAYERTVKSDGSIELTFEARRLSKSASSSLAVAMLLGSCTVTSPLLLTLTDKKSVRDEFPVGPIIMWLMIAFALWIFVVRKTNLSRGKLVVMPNEGVLFSGKRLLFKDLQHVGVERDSSATDSSSAYVYARSGGATIKLTGYVTAALAGALVQNINGVWRKAFRS